MKFHPLCAAALLACVAQTAAAQGQVTIFGVLDLAVKNARASGVAANNSLEGDGNTSSRLGFRGTEDIGGGLKANFWIETAVNVNDGTSGTTSTDNKTVTAAGAFTWGRRATVGLQGNWGEIRLGRDYVPSFNNLTTAMHPFGTNGVGSSGHLFYPVPAGGTTARTNVRASNSIGYHAPTFGGGFSGSVMVASGHQPSGTATAHDGNHYGARLDYRGGGLRVAVATGKTEYVTGDYTQTNLGINYQWGPAKLMYLWGENKIGLTRTRAHMIGTQWQVRPGGEVRLAYTTLKASGVANDATHLALGYVHDLSKRTVLYGNIAQIDNKGIGMRFNVGLRPTTAGGTSSGTEVGLRHTF